MTTPCDVGESTVLFRAAAERVLDLRRQARVFEAGRLTCVQHPEAHVLVDVFLSAPHVTLTCARCRLRLAEVRS